MRTSEQILAAQNVIEEKKVVLRFAYVQEGFGHLKPVPMFNVLEGDYAANSTITLETCFRLGLRVEVVE